jgi:hypothetical protein
MCTFVLANLPSAAIACCEHFVHAGGVHTKIPPDVARVSPSVFVLWYQQLRHYVHFCSSQPDVAAVVLRQVQLINDRPLRPEEPLERGTQRQYFVHLYQ